MQPPYELNSDRRAVVLQTLVEVCSHRRWTLLAAHVRTNHVHVIAEAEVAPERVMNDFKAYASRAMNPLDRNKSDLRRWARHGSMRWLWKDQDVRKAIRYVVEEQGEPIAVSWGTCPENPPTARSRAQLSYRAAPGTDLACVPPLCRAPTSFNCTGPEFLTGASKWDD